MAVSFVVAIVLFPQSNQFGRTYIKLFSLCNKKSIVCKVKLASALLQHPMDTKSLCYLPTKTIM